MNQIVRTMDKVYLCLKSKLFCRKEAVDQIIVMFIIIAVAAGFAGLIYVYGTGTLLPAFESKLTNLINSWFDHT